MADIHEVMSNTQPVDSLAHLRNHLLNSMLLGTSLVALPAVAISLWRITTLGWKPVMLLHIVLVFMLWTLWLLRASIPYPVRASILMLTFWLVGMGGYLQLGPAAGGSVFFLLLAFSSMLLFNARTGWFLVGISALSVIGIGFAAVQHWLNFNLDFQTYAYHPSTWLNIAWSLDAFSVVVAYVGWRMVHGVRAQDAAALELASRLHKISANVPGVIYQYLLRPDGSSCFPYASDGIRDIYGVTPDAVQTDASAVFAVLHPDDLAHVTKTIQDSAHNLTEWHDIYRVNHPWKGEIWVEGRSTPERLANGDIVWHGFISDISARKRAEMIKSEFVSTVSHELRTPLTSIRGSLGLIAGGVAGELPGKAKTLIDIALSNGERLGNLINDLLDIEKIASGKMKLDLQSQPLMPLIEQALTANQGYAQTHDVTFVLTQRMDDAVVAVDAARLQQVLANFLSNAAKFSPANNFVEIAVTPQNDKVRISVTDHGAGIPEEFHQHIFEKFSQADASDKRAKGGTGLGLAISKEFIERMQGQVGFSSTPHVETSFWVDLPLLRIAQAS